MSTPLPFGPPGGIRWGELLRSGLEIRALAHITSDGFLNLARAAVYNLRQLR